MSEFILHNAELKPADEPIIGIDNRGFSLGHGLFETIFLLQGKPCFLRQHIERLNRSAAQFCLQQPWTSAELANQIDTLVHANQVDKKNSGLRLTLSARSHLRGLNPQKNYACDTVLQTFEIPETRNLKLWICQNFRRPCDPLSQMKSLSYSTAILSLMEAQQRGYDDVLLLNTHDHVAECSTSSLFLYTDGAMFTPALDQGILPSITRQNIIQICQSLSISVHECAITTTALQQANQVFICNAIRQIRLVQQINDTHYSVELSEVFQTLQAHLMKKMQESII